jgi:hypothetical protein
MDDYGCRIWPIPGWQKQQSCQLEILFHIVESHLLEWHICKVSATKGPTILREQQTRNNGNNQYGNQENPNELADPTHGAINR